MRVYARIGLVALLILIPGVISLGNPIPSPIVQLQAPVEGLPSYCSGFVINKQKQYVLTADHCMETPFLPIVDGKSASEIYHDQNLDIAVLLVPGLDLDRPELKPSLRFQNYEEPVTLNGFAGEVFNKISAKLIWKVFFIVDPDSNTMSPPYTAFTPDGKQGMSGGPILDFEGKVIGMVQMGREDLRVTLSAPISQIYESVKQFWSVDE